LISLRLVSIFEPRVGEMQFVERVPWIEEFGISYTVGVDGISLFLVLLTTLLTSVVLLASWEGITDRVRGYHMLILIQETGMLGTLLSLDLFLFYVFWEAMIIPMYFLIGIWGGGRKVYAAVKFVLFTMTGSLLMLVGILYLASLYAASHTTPSFDLTQILTMNIPMAQQIWLFVVFSLAFAIKVPLFPLHTWLPDAHVEAPTGGSVILAGVLLKMGTYGFLRLAMPLFPLAVQAAVPWIAALAVVGIIYGALVAMVQPDLKKLVAYTSVSHLGFVMLGLFALNPQGVQGAIYQMLNHGLSTGALFLIVGIIDERRHTRLIADFGGLAKVIPVFAACFLVVTLSSIGLPALSGFVGEFLILLGAFKSYRAFTVVAALGVVLGALTMLRMFQNVMFGPVENAENLGLKDLSMREVAVLTPILILILLMGLYPSPFLSRMEPSVEAFLSRVEMKKTISIHSPGGPG
jgi:NADH-quinone oxidoreductase subunit M